MALRPVLFLVDAFVGPGARGNPAVVCLLRGPAPSRWMQRLARRMGVSETAFVRRARRGFSIRWFTPKTEVGLCGHATLAGAHVLWERGLLSPGETALFASRGGRLTARRRGAAIALDLPARPARPARAPRGLAAALGASPVAVAGNRGQLVCELESEGAVRRLRPRFAAIRLVTARDVIVTARGRGRWHFVSRCFAPGCGIDEDPVTGSAHCALAPYWSRRQARRRFAAFQASARGGVLAVELRGRRVLIGGRARTVREP